MAQDGAGKHNIAWNKTLRRQAAKERIKNAYSSEPRVKVIPPIRASVQENPGVLRVAAYCRVSTEDDAQSGSYELQIQYYTNRIQENPNWQLAGIYADEGLSGTSAQKRPQFLKMIRDCEAGKIDMILVKNVSRFMRNNLDFLTYIRKLKALDPPVGIFFENHNVNTLDPNAEMVLSLLSSIAQGESQTKSESIKWAIRQRFLHDLPLCPTWAFLGYDKDAQGKMFIVPQEAKVVRLIYNRYLAGYTVPQIARELSRSGVPTTKGLRLWPPGSVRNILCNEKYCGDVVMQKTYTPDFLSHKSVKNRGKVEQFFLEDHHPAIISREKWLLVQEQLKYRRYPRAGTRKPPRIHIVQKGVLEGFLVIQPEWDAWDTHLVFEKMSKKMSVNLPERGENDVQSES